MMAVTRVGRSWTSTVASNINSQVLGSNGVNSWMESLWILVISHQPRSTARYVRTLAQGLGRRMQAAMPIIHQSETGNNTALLYCSHPWDALSSHGLVMNACVSLIHMTAAGKVQGPFYTAVLSVNHPTINSICNFFESQLEFWTLRCTRLYQWPSSGGESVWVFLSRCKSSPRAAHSITPCPLNVFQILALEYVLT